jgi:hypothetical protein
MTWAGVAGLILLYLATVYIAYGLTVWWEVKHGISRDFRETRGFFVVLWPLTVVAVILGTIGYYLWRVFAIPADLIHDYIYKREIHS